MMKRIKVEVDNETLKDILTPVRSEDNSNDLWTVFNICQEKMIKGGFFTTTKNNKTRKQRGNYFNQEGYGV